MRRWPTRSTAGARSGPSGWRIRASTHCTRSCPSCRRSKAMPTLILLRHGQSQWNLENRFTGWWDVDVTEKGEAEARAAGQLLVDKGMDLDRVFTSVQKRAIRTANLTL